MALANVTLEGTTSASLRRTVPVAARSLKTTASASWKSVAPPPGTRRKFWNPLEAPCQTLSATAPTVPCQRTESPATVRVILEPVSLSVPLWRPLRPAMEPAEVVSAEKPPAPPSVV